MRSPSAPGEYGLFVAVRAGRIKLGDDLRKELIGIPGTPGAPVEPLLPIPVRVAPEILIAAVEQHQGRMRRQSYDILAGLGFNLLPERRLFRVGRAGQQEVLPDQQSALVAGPIEVLALEDATAPDANQVDIGGEGLVEPTFDPLSSDPGQEVIIRDPVHAFDEHRLAVDRDGECGADVVAGGVQFDACGTQSSAASDRVPDRLWTA